MDFGAEVDTALTAVEEKVTTWCRGMAFSYRSGALFIRLPSGRMLSYMKPVIVMNQYKKRAVTYLGSGEGKVWDRVETYGPKLCENIVQGIARDVLCEAMGRVRGMKDIDIVAHVHDEIVAEATEGTSVDELCDVMGRVPEWAPGLLLRAEGFTTKYYCK